MPLKISNTLQAHAQIKMTQGKFQKPSETSSGRDQEILLSALNQSPNSQLFMSAQISNAR